MKSKIRVMIVDDSALMRQQLTAMLSRNDRFEIAGVARDGEEAVSKAVQLRPDVITMDILMPKMDGLTSLQYIKEMAPCPVIILSAHSQRGAVITFEALELGAFDFVTKPDGNHSLDEIEAALTERIMAAAQSRRRSSAIQRIESLQLRNRITQSQAAANADYGKIVVIGASTGGPRTVMDILQQLPENFPAPVLLIQHMPPMFTASFAERLNRRMPMRVVEAKHRMVLESGVIYVAPGGYHLTVENVLGTNQLRIAIRSHPAEAAFRPSVDVSMQSLLQHVPAKKLIGVLLTGIGADGADGMVHIREGGGVTIAESEETAAVFGMPRAAAERGGAQYVLPSYLISEAIKKEVT
jgi:two-component system chemotaxis response regulator CheB